MLVLEANLRNRRRRHGRAGYLNVSWWGVLVKIWHCHQSCKKLSTAAGLNFGARKKLPPMTGSTPST